MSIMDKYGISFINITTLALRDFAASVMFDVHCQGMIYLFWKTQHEK